MSDMEKYLLDSEHESKAFDFVNIDFFVDMREAKKRYQSDYKKDVNNIRALKVSFDDWLDSKKFEAAKFYIKHNKLNTERK